MKMMNLMETLNMMQMKRTFVKLINTKDKLDGHVEHDEDEEEIMTMLHIMNLIETLKK